MSHTTDSVNLESSVLIDTSGVAVGTYELIYESYNTLSNAKSALKTDIITIIIVECTPSPTPQTDPIPYLYTGDLV